MILNVSGRTDVVAFYTDWFLNRYNIGYLDVRNPFYPKNVSRIYFSDVDLILFCTKNPIPIVDKLKSIKKPIIFHITLTPYKKDIEPNVGPKGLIIEAIKKISSIIGIENVYIRYDPVFINKKYTLDYHIKSFDNLCNLLDGYVKNIIISFIDDYKNVRNNYKFLNIEPFTDEIYKSIGINFSKSAKKHNMTVQTCCENNNLVEYGFIKEDCLSKQLALKLTGKKFSKWKSRNCNCVEMVDVGVYNSCKHFCKYCYANYDEKQVISNNLKHNMNSSLLVGELESDDIIKVRH
jgi:hypothetical protein